VQGTFGGWVCFGLFFDRGDDNNRSINCGARGASLEFEQMKRTRRYSAELNFTRQSTPFSFDSTVVKEERDIREQRMA
jgi:hypothetical protein